MFILLKWFPIFNYHFTTNRYSDSEIIFKLFGNFLVYSSNIKEYIAKGLLYLSLYCRFVKKKNIYNVIVCEKTWANRQIVLDGWFLKEQHIFKEAFRYQIVLTDSEAYAILGSRNDLIHWLALYCCLQLDYRRNISFIKKI